MKWYEVVLKNHKQKIIQGILIAIVFYVIHTLQTYYSGSSFSWEKVDLISQPNIFQYRLYSALAFVTVGAFLFRKFKLWQFIYASSSSRTSYRKNKRDLWKVLVLITIGLVFLVIKLINATLSIVYNLWQLVLYLLPSIGLTIVVLGLFLILNHFLKRRPGG